MLIILIKMCEKGVPNASLKEWVEIIEPKTKVQMFANLITGECRWDEPKGQGVVISRATNPQLTQWWELYDNNSQRFYYYCAKDSKTVWRRPTTPDAIVVPLAKLQILKQNTTTNVVSDSRFVSIGTQTEPQLCSRSTQTNSENDNNYYFHNSFRNPSLKHYLISEARLTHAMKGNPNIGNDFDYDSNDDFDDVLEDSDLSCDADDEYDCDYTDDEEDDTDDDTVDGLSSTGRYDRRDPNDEYDTEDDIRRNRYGTSTSDDRYDDQSVKNRDNRKISSLFGAQTSPTGSQTVAGQSSAPTKSHSLTQISANLSRNNVNQSSKRLTQQLTTAQTTSTTQLRPQTPPNIRHISQALSLVPTTTSTTGRSQKSDQKDSQKTSLLSIESFAKENIERHRKRGIFIGKKVSLKSMLEWSKKSIKKPMISSISDQKLRHESKVMFKFVQKFMRDLSSTDTTVGTTPVVIGTSTDARHQTRQQLTTTTTVSDDTEIALYLLTTAAQQPILRDELLVQIARQTNNNPNPDSELRGLRLMCACFWYFPPSAKLAPHLEAFVSQHNNSYARECVKRKFEQQLRRSLTSHVVYVRKPHDLEEVSRVLRCVQSGFCGVFGETLSDALIDDKLIPWPITCLTEALLRNGSNGEREGVFRCVGDLDEVTRLKIQMDTIIISGQNLDSITSLSINYDDIHVIASALKLYFRELKEPLMPFDLYFEALESAHNYLRAEKLILKLPEVNRLSFCYLIRFLQVFSAPEHVQLTKMDDANLSMVWAPNILRCPLDTTDTQITSQKLSNIFERTRSEMSFVRTLIQQMDTQFMSGIQ